MANGNNQKRDGLRILFPTLIYEGWFPNFSSIQQQLIAFNRKLREDDRKGRKESSREYSTGFTSYFSRQDLYKLPELQSLSQFLQQSAHNYAQQHHWDTQKLRPDDQFLMGQYQFSIQFSSRTPSPLFTHQWCFLCRHPNRKPTDHIQRPPSRALDDASNSRWCTT